MKHIYERNNLEDDLPYLRMVLAVQAERY